MSMLNSLSEKEVQAEIKALTYRHVAWMTALRYSMRMSKPWETAVNHKTNKEWDIQPPERESSLD